MKRKNNYDLLRIISAIAIITIHISARYLNAITNSAWFGEVYTNNMFVSCLYNALSRFAVPCFIMLSGAFALDNEKNKEFKYYYNKVFWSIGITTIIVSIMYFLCSFLMELSAVIMTGANIIRLLKPVKNLIKGASYYHLWYMYMIIGIFIMTPFVIRFKDEVGEKLFAKITIIFFPLAMLCLWTSTHKLYWDFGVSFCYLGYYMMGYIIKKYCSKKNNYMACLMIVLGILVEIGIAYFRYCQGIAGIADGKLKYKLVEPYCPLPSCAAILIFIGFSMLDIKRTFNKLAGITFEIYLFHAGIWDIINRFIKVEMDNRVVIPLSIIIVFVLSVLISIVYKKIWKAVDMKWGIMNKM